MKWNDPIVSEVRSIREEIFREQNYNFKQFCESLKKKQIQEEKKIMKYERKGKHGKTKRPTEIALSE